MGAALFSTSDIGILRYRNNRGCEIAAQAGQALWASPIRHLKSGLGCGDELHIVSQVTHDLPILHLDHRLDPGHVARRQFAPALLLIADEHVTTAVSPPVPSGSMQFTNLTCTFNLRLLSVSLHSIRNATQT